MFIVLMRNTIKKKKNKFKKPQQHIIIWFTILSYLKPKTYYNKRRFIQNYYHVHKSGEYLVTFVVAEV
jgi:hypothetical protein